MLDALGDSELESNLHNKLSMREGLLRKKSPLATISGRAIVEEMYWVIQN